MSKKIFEYNGHWLWKRMDTSAYYIAWRSTQAHRGWSRRSTGTDNLESAKQQLVAFVHERSRPRDRQPDGVPILEVLAYYVNTTLEGRPSQFVGRAALAHLGEFLEIAGITVVSQVTLDQQDAYIAWRRQCLLLQGHKASNGTISRELDVLRAALREYWKRGYLTTCPFIRSLPAPPPRQRFLTLDEWHRLISACREPHLRLFCELGIHTLQRPGAILDLQTSQVDLTGRRIDFLPPGSAQSNKRRPVVPINDSLLSTLAATLPRSRSGFVVEYNGVPVQSVKRAFARACRKADLEDVTPGTLRHSGATWMAASGVPMRQISGMLGHSMAKTTARYTKHSPSFLMEAATTLDRLFGPAAGNRSRGGSAATPDLHSAASL